MQPLITPFFLLFCMLFSQRSDASDSPTVHVEYIAKTYHGSSQPQRRPNNASRADANPPPHRSTIVANYQQTLLKNHADAITAIAVIDLPFRCIVSADRSGSFSCFIPHWIIISFPCTWPFLSSLLLPLAGVIHIYECKDRSRFRADE